MLTTPFLDVALISGAEHGELNLRIDAGFVNSGQLLSKAAVFGVGFEELVGFVDDETLDVLQANARLGLPLEETHETAWSGDQHVETGTCW